MGLNRVENNNNGTKRVLFLDRLHVFSIYIYTCIPVRIDGRRGPRVLDEKYYETIKQLGAIVTEGIATDLSSPGENTGNTLRAARPESGTLMPCFTVSEFEK